MKGLSAVCGQGRRHRGAQPVVRSVGGKGEGDTGCLLGAGGGERCFPLEKALLCYLTALAKQVPSCPAMS